MTVIAWDGRTLAADKRTSFGGAHATTTKVHRLASGELVAGVGNTAQISEMLAWLAGSRDPATYPADAQRKPDDCVSMLVVQLDGTLHQYEHTAHPIVIENRQWSIGSGGDFAMMAMHLGKTAVEAVELASLFCSNCGNGVDALELKPYETLWGAKGLS